MTSNRLARLGGPLIAIALTAACIPLTPIAPTPTTSPTRTPTPTRVPSATPIATAAVGAVRIVMHDLVGFPALDPLSFDTLQGRHFTASDLRVEPGKAFPNRSYFDEMRFSMWAQLGPDRLIAREQYDSDHQGTVTVLRNGREIYQIPVGQETPLTALRGLWVYDDHWVLETALVNPIGSRPHVTGQLTLDGTLLNAANGYDEAFGFQTLAGRPFYFYQYGGLVEAWYDGQEIPFHFDHVPHDGSSEGPELRPYSSPDRVDFFGVRGDGWYFVQIGTPGSFGP